MTYTRTIYGQLIIILLWLWPTYSIATFLKKYNKAMHLAFYHYNYEYNIVTFFDVPFLLLFKRFGNKKWWKNVLLQLHLIWYDEVLN